MNWKVIDGYEEYKVSDTGRVVSTKWGKERELTPYLTDKGYYKVWLYKGRKRKMFFVHRLVMLHFGGEAPEGKNVVNHLDGDPTNNHINNLEWTDDKGNDTHARKLKLKGQPYKLTPEVKRDMIEKRKSGLSVIKIAQLHGVHRNTVYRALEEG